MKRLTLLIPVVLFMATAAFAEDMPHSGRTLWMISAEQLEWRDHDEGNASAWDVDAWIGDDNAKISLASEGEREEDETESAETSLSMQYAIAPYWDIQLGWRRDWQPDAPNRDWAMLAFTGTAPYFIETNVQFFLGGDTRTQLRVELEKELLLTQRLELVPMIELTAFGRRDDAQHVDHGLAKVEAGLRLHYSIRRQFAPYIGLHHERLSGGTATMAEAEGHDTRDTVFTAGLRLWY